jgi:hypothetical protein
MSDRGRILRRGHARVSVTGDTKRSVSLRADQIGSARIDVDLENDELLIVVDDVTVSRLSVREIIRRERVLLQEDGVKASIDHIPGLKVRILLDVAATFTQAEALNLAMESFSELVVRRIAAPVREAIVKLTTPQRGRIISP